MPMVIVKVAEALVKGRHINLVQREVNLPVALKTVTINAPSQVRNTR
jgi:hypothetical protein